MHKRNAAEWVLNRAAGADRGTAIYGDLIELAAMHSRAWFWLAYARTLLSLTWRIGLAFLIGCLSPNVLLMSFQWWDSLMHDETRAAPGFVIAFLAMGLLPAMLIMTLLLFAPYALIRYGLRDRMACLAGVVFLFEAASFLADSLNYVCFVPLALLLAALCLKAWRRPALVLIATIATSTAVLAGLTQIAALTIIYIQEHLPHPHPTYKLPDPWNAIIVAAMLLIMLVCTRLRNRMLISTSPRADARA